MISFSDSVSRWPLKLFLPLICACSSALADIWVVTDQTHPIKNAASVRLILLSDQEHLEDRLTAKLPADLTQAPAAIQAYLSSPDGMKLQQQLARAQQDVTDAWSTGVEKIPAVVVDRRYVVYGETDVRKAIEKIDAYRSAER